MIEINASDFNFAKPLQEAEPVQMDVTPIFVSEGYSFVSGWLKRLSLRSPTRWDYIYSTLTEGKLKYFADSSTKTPTGVFDLSQLTTTIATIKRKKFFLEFYGCSVSFMFKAETFEERQHWLNALNIHINNYEPKDLLQSYISSLPNFWRTERISDFWFENNASTADLLFFRSKHIGASIYRGLAECSYDHIGLLLCYSTGKIAVLESTESEGIQITEWGEFLNKKLMSVYTRIGFKKLNVDRNEEFLDGLSNFLESCKGKSYKRSARRAAKGNHNWPGCEKYGFSAETIALAYKSLGILDIQCSIDKLWPADFEKDRLNLVQGSLSYLVEIDFNLY